jgi:peptide-methionine (S)-S-oxide reductase
MFGFMRKKLELPTPEEALPGRATPIPTARNHFVNGNPLKGPYPQGAETAYFALGCYWGAERKFWQVPGVWVTAVGNIAGLSPNPTYEEVCSGRTGHAEAVMVVYDPAKVSYEELLKVFWEAHDPTQGMRQGNDMGTQYRSGIYWTTEAQRDAALASRALTRRRWMRAASRRSPPRSSRRPSFTSPRTITSNTWPRTPMAIAALAAPACLAPSAQACRQPSSFCNTSLVVITGPIVRS